MSASYDNEVAWVVDWFGAASLHVGKCRQQARVEEEEITESRYAEWRHYCMKQIGIQVDTTPLTIQQILGQPNVELNEPICIQARKDWDTYQALLRTYFIAKKYSDAAAERAIAGITYSNATSVSIWHDMRADPDSMSTIQKNEFATRRRKVRPQFILSTEDYSAITQSISSVADRAHKKVETLIDKSKPTINQGIETSFDQAIIETKSALEADFSTPFYHKPWGDSKYVLSEVKKVVIELIAARPASLHELVDLERDAKEANQIHTGRMQIPIGTEDIYVRFNSLKCKRACAKRMKKIVMQWRKVVEGLKPPVSKMAAFNNASAPIRTRWSEELVKLNSEIKDCTEDLDRDRPMVLELRKTLQDTACTLDVSSHIISIIAVVRERIKDAKETEVKALALAIFQKESKRLNAPSATISMRATDKLRQEIELPFRQLCKPAAHPYYQAAINLLLALKQDSCTLFSMSRKDRGSQEEVLVIPLPPRFIDTTPVSPALHAQFSQFVREKCDPKRTQDSKVKIDVTHHKACAMLLKQIPSPVQSYWHVLPSVFYLIAVADVS